MGNLSTKLTWDQANPLWAAQINPVLANLLIQGLPINSVVLVSGVSQTLNHGLGKNQTGFFVTDQNAAASIFRTLPFNSKTITLQSSADVTVNLWVY